MLNGSVAVVKVGADSKIELKEKKDRIEDSIYAVKAALKEGIVPGGGIALVDSARNVKPKGKGEEILAKAILSPFYTILDNGGMQGVSHKELEDGIGIDVTCGCKRNMIETGIIDPVLVTKSALKNAISVVSTIISADCVISNVRISNASS